MTNTGLQKSVKADFHRNLWKCKILSKQEPPSDLEAVKLYTRGEQPKKTHFRGARRG